MTPDEWAHIRSIAKWVLPVLVGPRMALRRPSDAADMITILA
jgi:hypothetical protein